LRSLLRKDVAMKALVAFDEGLDMVDGFVHNFNICLE
jgi:hypothetical protein